MLSNDSKSTFLQLFDSVWWRNASSVFWERDFRPRCRLQQSFPPCEHENCQHTKKKNSLHVCKDGNEIKVLTRIIFPFALLRTICLVFTDATEEETNKKKKSARALCEDETCSCWWKDQSLQIFLCCLKAQPIIATKTETGDENILDWRFIILSSPSV